MTLSVTVKALCIGRSIVSAANVAHAKVAPLSSAAAKNSRTDLAWRMDGIVSREGVARKSEIKGDVTRWQWSYKPAAKGQDGKSVNYINCGKINLLKYFKSRCFSQTPSIY